MEGADHALDCGPAGSKDLSKASPRYERTSMRIESCGLALVVDCFLARSRPRRLRQTIPDVGDEDGGPWQSFVLGSDRPLAWQTTRPPA